MAPNIPKLKSMAVTLTAANPRWANSRMSSMGCSTAQLPGHEGGQGQRSDHERGQHRRWRSSRGRCPGPGRRPRRTVRALTSPTPARSNGADWPRDSARRHRASGTRAIPTGTLSQKMYCQAQPVVTAPPTSGPMAMATPPMAPQMPRAALRRSGRTAALRRVSDRGMIIAPPAPCRARAATRTPMLGARAATRRRGGEQGDAGHEDPPPSEPLAQGGGRQQQDGEGQGVGVDRPLEAGQAGVEVDPDHREGGRHHQVVEGGHEQGQPGDDHGPHGPGPGGTGRVLDGRRPRRWRPALAVPAPAPAGDRAPNCGGGPGPSATHSVVSGH